VIGCTSTTSLRQHHVRRARCPEREILIFLFLFILFYFRIHFDNITRDELAAIEQEILLLQKLRHQHIVSYMVCICVCVCVYMCISICICIRRERERARASERDRQTERERETEKHTHTHTHTHTQAIDITDTNLNILMEFCPGGSVAHLLKVGLFCHVLGLFLQGVRWHTCSR
jgi:serine/threonine protein kinase